MIKGRNVEKETQHRPAASKGEWCVERAVSTPSSCEAEKESSGTEAEAVIPPVGGAPPVVRKEVFKLPEPRYREEAVVAVEPVI